MKALESKLTINRQRNNLKHLTEKENKLEIMATIFHPESSSLVCSALGMASNSKTKKETTSFEEVKSEIANKIDNSWGAVICILPGVSLDEGNAITSLPAIKIAPNQIETLYSRTIDSNLDFLAIFKPDLTSGIIIDACENYPCEENDFHAGGLYEIYTWG